jgi:hypothetical protein
METRPRCNICKKYVREGYPCKSCNSSYYYEPEPIKTTGRGRAKPQRAPARYREPAQYRQQKQRLGFFDLPEMQQRAYLLKPFHFLLRIVWNALVPQANLFEIVFSIFKLSILFFCISFGYNFYKNFSFVWGPLSIVYNLISSFTSTFAVA